MVKLQLALDMICPEKAVELLNSIEEEIDIIEAGTPFLLEYGVRGLRELRLAFPKKTLLADSKIMDAGYYESSRLFDAGVNIVTVLGVTDNQTILDCMTAARQYGGHSMADMICVPDLAKRAVELEAIGVKKIAVHTGVDAQKLGRTPLGDLKLLRSCIRHADISVAGGLSPESVADYLVYDPETLIVGSYIINAEDPVLATQKIRAAIRRGEGH